VNVLIATAAGERGGAEIAMELIAARLDRSRFAPILAAPHGSPLFERWRAAGLDVEGTLPVRRLRDPVAVARAAWQTARLVRARRIGLVHTNGVATQVHAGLGAVLARTPVVAHVRDIFDASRSRNGWLHRLSLAVPRRATIAASHGVADSLARRGRAAEIIPDPVATEIVAPVAYDGHNAPLVLWCGRLQRWKGCHHFLRAARLVLDARPDVRFAVVGGTLFGLEPEYAAELHALARTLGLEAAVHFAGHVPDARPWLRACAILVHCTERPEPFGMIMAEAMIQERPIVAFRHGAAEENVADGGTGLLVAPGDTTALAQAILRLLADPDARRRMGGEGRAHAMKFYADAVVARHVEAVYDRVLGEQGSVHG
jgi:glycosyltransferase involved in cell wall biosynthesis